MRTYIRKAFLPAVIALCMMVAAPLFGEEGDPPGRVARLSVADGNVSFQAAGEDQWNQATLNYPLTTGDRVYTDNDARAELETGNVAVRLAANTDLTTTNLNDQFVQLGLSQGTLRVRAYDIREGNSVEIDTPNAALTLLRSGSYRVETYPEDNRTLVTVNAGDLEVNGSGFSQTVHAGEAVMLSGADQGQLDFISVPGNDDFDRWCGDRDRRFLSSQSRGYVGPYVPGYADLDQYGSWEPAPEYGQVWFPSAVPIGWVPYRYGHWAWVEPWGWTWVEDEPWGFAPFHYGRWVEIGPRWGWIPGPVVIRPVYAPALVAFVGGGFSVGVGVQCWFPLGPRDPYFPWYHHSDVYLRQVNVTNVTVRNVTYINNYINVRNADNVHYAYQRVAPTAVSTEAFRTAQPVARQVVRVNGGEMARARVVPHPEVTPDVRAIAAGAPVAHPPVERYRQTVINRNPASRGTGEGGAQNLGGNRRFDRGANSPPPSANTSGGNVPFERGTHTPPTQVPMGEGNVPLARGTHTPPTQVPMGENNVPLDRGTHTPPAQVPFGQGNPPMDRGAHNPPQLPATGGERNAPFERGMHTPPTQVNPGANAAAGGGPPRGYPAGGPPQDRRPLYNSAPPPPQNPPFSQRQPVMEQHPGRPLEPQQVNNIRQGQPAGVMHDREYAPHQQQAPPRSNSRSTEHDKRER